MFSKSQKEKEERLRLDEYVTEEQDHSPTTAGVLLSDEIEEYCKKFKLIDPFDPEKLKPAGYELSAGDEWYKGGTKFSSKDENRITIPAFEVAVLKTAETVNLPRFLIARWNIRVKHAYRGLLWVGGPQVDPGWKGHLFCPIYNLSDRDVTIHFGEPIALMDFTKRNFTGVVCWGGVCRWSTHRARRQITRGSVEPR